MMGVWSLEKLREANRLIERMAPPPFFASSSKLPADAAMMFKLNGRQYVGAHPDFWATIPAREMNAEGNPFPFSGITVWDLDVDRNRSADFFAAYARVLGTLTPDSQDSA